VDWISNLIFIAVQSLSRTSISVTDLDGQYFTTIIQQDKQGLRNINSIAVNPYKAQIYWPDGSSSNNFSIQSASMDGSSRKMLTNVRDNPLLDNPASLSYDITDDRLYWINFNTDRIQYYDFQQQAVKTISFEDMKPHVITVYKNYLFFATEKQNAILKGDKTLGGKAEVVRNNTGRTALVTYFINHYYFYLVTILKKIFF
jgi:sugar lactone lactonase YvrE